MPQPKHHQGAKRAAGAILLMLAFPYALVATGHAKSFEVDCRISGDMTSLQADFGPRFCEQLIASLSRETGMSFSARPAARWSNGPALAVHVRIRKPTVADVEISRGAASRRGFVKDRSRSITLTAHDRQLTPFSAVTLALPIGKFLR
jgi:hypothetical protein